MCPGQLLEHLKQFKSAPCLSLIWEGSSSDMLTLQPTEVHTVLPRVQNIPRSVISANVRLALRWRSMFSEKTRVLSARRGSPEKKSVSPRYNRLS